VGNVDVVHYKVLEGKKCGVQIHQRLLTSDVDWVKTADKAIGPAIALQVNAGDKIDAVAWTRFEEKASFNKNFDLIALSSLLGSSFVSMAGFEGYTVSQAASTIEAALLAGNFPDDGAENNRPFAYLSYMVYDNNMGFVDAGWVRVPEAAGTSEAALYLPENKPIRFGFENTIAVEQAGYVYIWVSNQSEQARVWFDDLTVTHTQTMVTQATDYGVWGDVLREMKAAEFTYRYGYQGQFAEKDEETGWNHFELREYDAIIGRWLVPDPKRQFYSPYIGMGNNPISGIDLDGGSVDDYYIYSDGRIEYVPTGNVDNFYYVAPDNSIITLAEGWQRNANGLLQLPANFCFDSDGISFGFSIKEGNLNRAFVNPESMAAMFGAFVESGATDLVITQFSYSNGTSPSPSISHINGKNGDFRYLRTDQNGAQVTVFEAAFDQARNGRFTEALYRFGYTDLKSYNLPNGGILPRTSHLSGHHNHLHLQGFKPNVQCTTLPSIFAGPRQ
jgi:RHS repeat-associated protein